MTEKLYAERDPMALEPHYSRHVLAMTAEGLHWKSNIAAQLAWRDLRIEQLEAALATQSPPKEKLCRGIPRPGCNYLAACDSVCNKCGKVHASHLLVAPPAQPLRAPTTCGYCTFEEADGELIEQCARCKTADAQPEGGK